MTTVVVRADATASGGIGHLVRGLAVVDAARAVGWHTVLAGEIETGLGHDLVAAAGVFLAPAGTDLALLAAEHGADIVHIDDYAISVDAHSQVARSGALLSSMEDGSFGRRRADLVVDSTMGAVVEDRPEDGSTLVLCGIDYAPMQPAVLRARQERAEREMRFEVPVRTLVVMGGSDATGAAGVIAGVCVQTPAIGELTVVAPLARWAEVRSVAGPDVRLVEPSLRYLELARDADLVISAAGTSTWELACLQVPTVLVAVVDNQVAGYRAAIDAGIAQGLGRIADIRADPVGSGRRLDALVRSWGSAPGADVVDGRGAGRIVEAWSELLSGARGGGRGIEVRARAARVEDALVLLRWRNDPDTRAASRNHDPVSWAEHSAWYERVMGDPDRALMVVEDSRGVLGTVRFDRGEAGEWEVSITVAPAVRGTGMSGRILAAAEDQMASVVGSVRSSLLAVVRTENEASAKLFRAAGYVADPGRRDGDLEVYVKEFAAI